MCTALYPVLSINGCTVVVWVILLLLQRSQFSFLFVCSFTWVPCVCVGLLQVFQLPPTSQKTCQFEDWLLFNLNVYGVLCPVMGWHTMQGVLLKVFFIIFYFFIHLPRPLNTSSWVHHHACTYLYTWFCISQYLGIVSPPICMFWGGGRKPMQTWGGHVKLITQGQDWCWSHGVVRLQRYLLSHQASWNKT